MNHQKGKKNWAYWVNRFKYWLLYKIIAFCHNQWDEILEEIKFETARHEKAITLNAVEKIVDLSAAIKEAKINIATKNAEEAKNIDNAIKQLS